MGLWILNAHRLRNTNRCAGEVSHHIARGVSIIKLCRECDFFQPPILHCRNNYNVLSYFLLDIDHFHCRNNDDVLPYFLLDIVYFHSGRWDLVRSLNVNISPCAARVAAFGNLGTLRDNMAVYSNLQRSFSLFF